MVSSMCMQFEMFLNDNVQFGSVDEVLQFIDHICEERHERNYNDRDILDNFYSVTEADVFYKLVKNCTWRWIPNQEELNIIWTVVSNLDQENLNRIWYKNNLYEFCENSKVFDRIRTILKKLKRPLFNSLDIPEEVTSEMAEFGALLKEYIYYKYMIIDRVDKCDNQIKSVVMVLDTDSNIVSLDAWYRFVSEKVSGEEFNIASYEIPYTFFAQPKDMQDEEWDKLNAKFKNTSNPNAWREPIRFLDGSNYDYDFETDQIVELDHYNHPEVITVNDNMRYSIMNILAYVLDIVVNLYMEEACRNMNSMYPDPNDPTKDYRKCKIISKNEFTFNRLMMTTVKKNYASLQSVQEGNLVPEEKQLDIKGIESMTKSSKSEYTRNALKKILLEDVMKAPVIDQLKFVKDIAILERSIVNDVMSGSKKYYKPSVVKSQSAYSDPMRIQGFKGSVAWNALHPKSDGSIHLNTEERNAVDICKVLINKATIEKIKDSYPEVYENALHILESKDFENGIDAVSVPIDQPTPAWLLEFVDIDEIISSNLGNFPYESIGIKDLNKGAVNYTNIVQL